MTWPLSQDYNEAIQDPRSSFSDAELKTGEAVANALGIPMPRSGNFADVYEIRCPSGSRWAVKCFTREVSGLSERYSEISKYLHQANLPFMVDFKFLEQGIRVRGQWYPILKMQWVEGFVLNEFVRDNLDKKPILQALGQIWLRMARRLRESYIAHCDLQHGNVMFVPGSKSSSLAVKLIDYDGMCVPSLLGTKSGEVGHPAYQHPERLRSGAYDQEVDRFSLLSIGTALRCLSIGGRSLWERYDNGDNLLFRQSDLQAPAESPLFQELMAIGDPPAQKLVTELFRSCQAPLAAVPLLTDLMPEEKSSGKVTKTVSASSAVAAPASGASGPDWDFGAEEPAPSAVKKRYKKSGMSLGTWGAMGGAAALLLVGIGVGLSLFLHKGPVENAATPKAHNKPETKLSKPKATSSTAKEVAQRSADVEDPPASPPAPPQGAQEESASGSIFCLTPAGDKLAISDNGDKDWRLLDCRTHQLIHRFAGHGGGVSSVAFSADGRRAVSSGPNGTIHLWDVQTGQMIVTRRPSRQPVLSLALSPDGNKMVHTNGSNDVEVWDSNSKKGHGYHNNQKVLSAAFSPDGRYLICGYGPIEKPQEPVLFLWPLIGGVPPRFFHAPAKAVTCITVSPNGKSIAAGRSGDPSELAIWDFDSRNPPRIIRLSERSPVRQVLFSPDSETILTAYGTALMLFRRNGSFLRSYPSRDPGITAAFSPDGKQVLHASHHQGKILHGAFGVPEQRITQPTPSAAPPSVAGNLRIDPNGDCEFKEADGKLTITIPKDKPYDLSVENGTMNGPRLLRDIEGDFTAEVHVSADFQESRIQAAGLFLMVDNQTYLRLERGRLRGGAVRVWELRRDGKPVQPLLVTQLSQAEGYLRLERRGNQVFASVSDDGKTWVEQKPFEIDLPRKVKIGVSAISVSGSFAATFDRFQIKQAQGDWVHIDKWLAPVGPVSPPAPAIAWESPTDPDGDCKFTEADGKLTITVPANAHTLDVVMNGRTNSPRLLFDVEGDFAVQVRVGGDFEPAAASAGGARHSWIGAGLLLWVDEKTFFRLERAGWYGRKPPLYANWEAREDGKSKMLKHNFPGLSGPATYLRLERRGKQILASYSDDGQNWRDVNPLDIELPVKVKIGILAGSTSNRPFAPTFDHFRIKKGQGEWVGLEHWLKSAESVAKPPQLPEEPEVWWSRFEVPRDLTPADKDAVVRLPAPRVIATREKYSGPLDITIEVRGPADHDVSFIAPGGAMVTFRRTDKGYHILNVRRPVKARGELGAMAAIGKPIALRANEWCMLHWEIESTGMKVRIDKQLVFQEAFRYDLTPEYPVKIRVNTASVEVKSVVVKRLGK